MILSGSEIKAQLGTNLKIEPYADEQLNPNSYNLSLHNELMVYEEIVLDMKRPNRYRRLTIPEEGLVLQPNQLYLGRTGIHRNSRLRSDAGRTFFHRTVGTVCACDGRFWRRRL